MCKLRRFKKGLWGDVMGGRGGTSGLSGGSGKYGFDINRIPERDEYVIKGSLPQLEGSEKQVAWAQDIRKQTVQNLYRYATSYTSDGRPFGKENFRDIAQGREAVAKSIMNHPLVSGSSGKTRQEKIEERISSYRDIADRVKIVREIASNKSAKFWIDNRSAAKMSELYEKIDHGVKKWKPKKN